MLWAALLLPFISQAKAQCTARDVLQNRLKLLTAEQGRTPKAPIASAADIQTWRTIEVGTLAGSFALVGALDAAGCKIGGQAEEILVRPAATVSATKTDVELVAVSATELGFEGDTAKLAAIYARAQQLGFQLATAEIGAQLRLQYFEQPIGEFRIIGIEPVRTWGGEPVILNVANGGAGLILIGQDGRADADIPAMSRIVFVRSIKAAPTQGIGEAAAVAHR
ncbi:hypothetical protein NLM33_37580 [Bradyrhizobium sp. CCGUVB1N3]|nr:hypothetical protein [Bradyrhizobium sp. CCGUVB1N3]MCP3475953.1 hypothetical protein [Bradyrhizobium sp. CCGUVB1N3]